MINGLGADQGKFTGSTRLILDEIRRRGWKASVLFEGSSHIFVDRRDGIQIHSFGTTPPQQGYAAALLSNNKFLTNLMLEQAGIAQLPFMTTDTGNDPAVEAFLQQHGKVVVKPIDGSHGDGIRLGVTRHEQARSAIANALKHSKLPRVLIQKQFTVDTTYDLRLLCMSGAFVAAIHRMPARVFGDGTSTVGALIEKENATEHRGKAYLFRYATIDYERAQEYLGTAVNEVPQAGQEVRVMDVANYGAGGELIDVTDAIPEWMKHEAEKAAQELDIVVAGVDYLTSALPTPQTTPDEIMSTIIEVNKSPALMIHDEPHVGKNRHTVERYVDLLAAF